MFYKPSTAFSIVLIFTALSFVGWLFLPLLSVRLQPSIGNQSFTIVSTWGNTSPTIVEEQLTSKIESAVNTIPGIEKIRSVSSLGRVKIDIEIDKYTNPAQLRLEVSSVIRRLYPELPEGISYPTIKLNSPDNKAKPILIYTLHGPHDSYALQQFAENNIRTSLSLIQGIEKIDIYGGTGYEWQISYKPEITQSLLITPDDIVQALQSYFYSKPIGYILEGTDGQLGSTEKRITVKIGIQQSETIPWETIPIKKIEDKIIYLGNIANISYVKQKINSYFRINGQNTINIVVYPARGSNAIKLSKEIINKVTQLKEILPNDYVLESSYNSTEYVSEELSKIYQRTVFTLIILIVFVFVVSFSFRYVVLIILSLFTNISLSFILYYFIGIEIHLYSLAGITVSLGLIIDNSIVMADHLIYRKNLKVYTALLSSTLTTVASLIIIWYLPVNLRINLWDFALIIIVNLCVSLLVSLFYIPALISRMPLGMGKKTVNYKKRKLIVRLNYYYTYVITFSLRYRALAMLLLILAFGIPVFMLPNKVQPNGMLPKLYNNTLGNEWYVDNIKPYLNKYLGGSFRLFSYYVFENSYYTDAKETKLYVNAAMPKGSTIEQLNSIFIEMEDFVGQYKDKAQYYSRVQDPQYANMTISFKDKTTENTFPNILKSKLIARSLDLGGVNWDIYGVGKGFSNRVGVNEMVNHKISIYGYNFNELETQALILQEKLEEHPRVRNVNISGSKLWGGEEKSYEYYVDLRPLIIDSRNANLNDIYYSFKNRALLGGSSIRLFTGSSYDFIKIISESNNSSDKWEIMNQPMGQSGHKLNEFLTIKKTFEQQAIYKENQNYIRIVDFQYVGSSKFGNIFLDKVLTEMKHELPLGYWAESLNSSINSKDDSVSYAFLILIVIVLIFVICSILFESLIRPFAIILTVPASFIGVFLTFYIFDFNFDQGGYASFVLITGLVVNSAIYLLNEFDNTTGKNKEFAHPRMYVKAFNRKISPIILTIISTVLGLVPFVAFGKDEPFWFALAAGTIGGLLFSIFIIVFYLPLFVLKSVNKS